MVCCDGTQHRSGETKKQNKYDMIKKRKKLNYRLGILIVHVEGLQNGIYVAGVAQVY